MKKALLGVVGILGLTILVGCSSTNVDPENWEPIVFGLSPDYPPLVQTAGEQEYTGYEVDLAKKVAYKLKRKPVFQEVALNELQQVLLNEDVDIVIGGILKHHSRGSIWSFSDPVLSAGQMAIIREDDEDKYTDIDVLRKFEGLRVGVVTGSSAESVAALLFKDSFVVPYASMKDAFLRLKMSDVDLLLHDAQTAWTCADASLVPLLTPLTLESYGWAVRPDDNILLEDINDAFIVLEHRGEIEKMKVQWIRGATRRAAPKAPKKQEEAVVEPATVE